MRRISKTAGHGGQLLAAAFLLIGSAASFPAIAQSALADRTCRPALGENFTVSSGPASVRCCMVVEEQAWYERKGVVSSRVYLSSDSLKVRAKSCSAAELASIGIVGPSIVPDDPEGSDDDGKPKRKLKPLVPDGGSLSTPSSSGPRGLVRTPS